MTATYRLLQLALVAVGAAMLLLYPLSAVWPSGWAWHDGAPHDSQYFMMIVGIYATLGAFLVNATRRPGDHLPLITGPARTPRHPGRHHRLLRDPARCPRVGAGLPDAFRRPVCLLCGPGRDELTPDIGGELVGSLAASFS